MLELSGSYVVYSQCDIKNDVNRRANAYANQRMYRVSICRCSATMSIQQSSKNVNEWVPADRAGRLRRGLGGVFFAEPFQRWVR